jgi:hypothetical protein
MTDKLSAAKIGKEAYLIAKGICACVTEKKAKLRKRRRNWNVRNESVQHYRDNLIRHKEFLLFGPRIEVLGDNPYRTGVVFFVADSVNPLDKVTLFLHRSLDMGTEGMPIATVRANGEPYSPDCACLRRAIQGEWCALASSPSGFALLYIHEILTIPKGFDTYGPK